MKKVFLSIVLLFLVIAGFSQDTLFTKDGRTIPAKIIEVRSTEVKYKSEADNTEKQYSIIDIANLSSIHYANGTYDTFPLDGSVTVNDNNGLQNIPTPDPAYNKKIARNEAIADFAFFSLRVLGFACRIALEIALLGNGHSGSHDSHSSGTYGKR
ncbi:MAG: hypothetical protein Q8L81_10460 [Bacteroidota bacterium]|nr:hypothetical protein [Bacteroidota bacterium]